MRAILFDVFGTLVDWRSSLIEQFQALERELGGTLPCVELTDRWRQQYKPAMDRVRNGQAPWQHLDQLHRQSLEALAGEFGLALDEALLQRITGFWHRLRPWPDTLAGMHALKADYWLAALSNGNTALMLDVARHAGCPGTCCCAPTCSATTSPTRRSTSAPAACSTCAAGGDALRGAQLRPQGRARPRPEDRVHRPAAGIRPRPVPGPRRRAGLGPDRSDLLDLHRQLAASA